jgi:hypothetical protein
MIERSIGVEWREAAAARWRPDDVHALNDNDVRSFIYSWYGAFERIERPEFFLEHFDPANMNFGNRTTPEEFRAWYTDWQEHCPWDFHEVAAIVVNRTESNHWVASVLLNHVGEWIDSPASGTPHAQRQGRLFARVLRQAWDLQHTGEKFMITRIDVALEHVILPRDPQNPGEL